MTNFDGEAEIELLTDSLDGYSIHFVDTVVVAKNGLIHFSLAVC
ncbi:hypothetical protein [Salipaludibacillus sp. CF4.18]